MTLRELIRCNIHGDLVPIHGDEPTGPVITHICDRLRFHIGPHASSVENFKAAANYWGPRLLKEDA